jgi:hypothetical protein
MAKLEPKARNEQVWEYRKSGMTFKTIAKKYGFSVQRGRQIVAALRKSSLISDDEWQRFGMADGTTTRGPGIEGWGMTRDEYINSYWKQ